MHTYPYWARARCTEDGIADARGDIVGVGWSSTSQEDAEQCALRQARTLAARLRSRDWPPRQQYYPDRPLREEFIDSLEASGEVQAIVTRNAYGAYVLNAAKAMFIDVDLPDPRIPKIWDEEAAKTYKGDARERIEFVLTHRPHLAMRLYQTAAGFRGLVTNRTFDPTSAESNDLLQSFGTDERYTLLCRAQKCYRARLTPKPWRCGLPKPTASFPWENDKVRREYEAWTDIYMKTIVPYATCKLVATYGPTEVDPLIAPVVEWHDRYACGDGALA